MKAIILAIALSTQVFSTQIEVLSVQTLNSYLRTCYNEVYYMTVIRYIKSGIVARIYCQNLGPVGTIIEL